jgi:predicted  nucleic acid-binding Zn-ribbon protein
MTTTRGKKKQSRKPVERGRTASDAQSEDRKAKLGAKHACYACGQRFYDLNKPEPICPKCGTDQRTKPKESAGTAPPPQPKRPPPRPMPALLDDEEGEAAPAFEDDMDLDLGDLDTGGEELFEDDADAAEPDEPEVDES